MPMTEFVVKDAIIPALAASTKDGVIREVVASLCAAGQIPADNVEIVIKAILKREQLGSTGIGRGIALPHTKASNIDHLTGTVAISPEGVAFDAIDGEPVYVFVLLISPQDRPGDHLRALENVVRNMRDDSFVKALRQSTTRDDVWKVLSENTPTGEK